MAGHHGINSAGSSAAAAANTTVAKSDTVLGADDKHVLNPESSDLCALHGFTHNTLRYGVLPVCMAVCLNDGELWTLS